MRKKVNPIAVRRLEGLRRARGESIKHVAKSLGMSYSFVYNLFHGKAAPSIGTVRALAEHFNTTTDYLLGLNNSPFPSRRSPELQRLLQLTREVPEDELEAIAKVVEILVEMLQESRTAVKPRVKKARMALQKTADMRIGICGAHGTGKTTLANALKEALQLPLISEQARIAAKEMGITIADVMRDIELARRFQARLFRTQVRLEEEYCYGFVSDRTLADIYGYCMLYGVWPEEKEKVFLDYVAKTLIGRYDLLVYVPIEFPLQADGFRDTCPTCQRAVDRHIREVLKASEVPYLRVTGNVEQRISQVISALASAGYSLEKCAV